MENGPITVAVSSVSVGMLTNISEYSKMIINQVINSKFCHFEPCFELNL